MYSSLFQQLLCQILDSTEKPNLDQKGLGLIVTVWFGLDIVGIVRHLADPYTTQSLGVLFSNVLRLSVKNSAGDRSVIFSAMRLVRLLTDNMYLSLLKREHGKNLLFFSWK